MKNFLKTGHKANCVVGSLCISRQLLVRQSNLTDPIFHMEENFVDLSDI